MKEYQRLIDPFTNTISTMIFRRSDNAFIPNDPANRDYQVYLEWLALGNLPDPPDQPVVEMPTMATNESHYSPEQELAQREKPS